MALAFGPAAATATAWRGHSVWTPRSQVSRATAGAPHTSQSVADSSSSAQSSSTNARDPRTSYQQSRPHLARQRNDPGGSDAAAAADATLTIPTHPGTGASSARCCPSTEARGRSISESLEWVGMEVRHLFGYVGYSEQMSTQDGKLGAGWTCWSLGGGAGRTKLRTQKPRDASLSARGIPRVRSQK